jgi:glycogen synthase
MVPESFDYVFQTKLSSWTLFLKGFETWFSPREIGLLSQAGRSFDRASRTVVLLAFENEYASLGGLSVVTKYLPSYLKKAGEQVVFLTPFHQNHKAVKEACDRGRFSLLFSYVLEFGDEMRNAACLKDITAEIPTYHIQIDGQFTAEEHPYSYSDQTNLLLDSLFFCMAVPQVLRRLGIKDHVLLHAHDWETAGVALTSKTAVVKNLLKSAKTVLTLHNSYDMELPRQTMVRFFSKIAPADTVLSAFIPLCDGPLTAVSTPFAHELRLDPLQRGVFTGHLQSVFSQNPPIGIENGVFGEKKPVLGPSFFSKSKNGSHEAVLSMKKTWFGEMRSCLERAADGRIVGSLDLSRDENRPPVFFLSGRFDAMQKGFDTLFAAFLRLPRGSAKLLFCPSMGENHGAGVALAPALDGFMEAAHAASGDIAIWPFRIPPRVYNVLLRGASFLVMPSLYEPFGAATEGYCAATPVVARATGGLWLQVDPVAPLQVPGFYRGLLDDLRFADVKRATGILYREEFPETLCAPEWKRLFQLPTRERMKSPLFEAVVEATYGALKSAVELFHRPEAYASLIVNGVTSLSQFDWDESVAKYRKVYDAASRSVL